ncbi:MAG: hypothetical protein AB8G22_21075 [Saprospiraceae bacterium]
MRYGVDFAEELQIDREVLQMDGEQQPVINWFDIRGMHDIPLIEELGRGYMGLFAYFKHRKWI